VKHHEVVVASLTHNGHGERDSQCPPPDNGGGHRRRLL